MPGVREQMVINVIRFLGVSISGVLMVAFAWLAFAPYSLNHRRMGWPEGPMISLGHQQKRSVIGWHSKGRAQVCIDGATHFRRWSVYALFLDAGQGFFIDIPRWIPVIGTAISAWVPVRLMVPPLKRWRRRRLGLCVNCGYNLTGLTEPRCPECGTPCLGK